MKEQIRAKRETLQIVGNKKIWRLWKKDAFKRNKVSAKKQIEWKRRRKGDIVRNKNRGTWNKT
jgi:hypothetical protein